MVRKKVYKKKHILKAASELFVTKEFSFITARNVAEHMGISTQPIYLEFKNMEDLKLTLLKTLYEGIETEYFSRKPTNDELVNFGLNYVALAKEDTDLYLALYSKKHSYGKELIKLSFDLFLKLVLKDQKFSVLSEAELEKLHMNLWITATGIASLSISGVTNLTEEELITVFKAVESYEEATSIK